MRPERFRRQLQGLLQLGYRFWPLSRVLRYHEEGKPVPAQTVVLTFDDGYENNFTSAWPILQELEVPGTIFLNTAYLDSAEPFPFEPWGVAYADRVPPDAWRPLSRSQCHEMLASGLVELGAHTHSHQDFRGRPDDFAADLQTNVALLQSEFGLDEVAFAFPYGSPTKGFASPPLIRAAQEVGVRCSLTTESAPADATSDPFQWGRFNAYDWDTPSTLAAKLTGWHRWATCLNGRLHRRMALQTISEEVRVGEMSGALFSQTVTR